MPYGKQLKATLSKLLSFFFPDRCIFCDSVLSYRKSRACICFDCLKKLRFLDEVKTCKSCGRMLTPAEDTLCSICQAHRHYFSRAYSCLVYRVQVRTAVLQYKFGNRREFCHTFGAILEKRIRACHNESPFDFVVCPPLSRKAYRERGYNQAALLAKLVAARLDIPACPKAFRKLRETPKQSTLSYAERFRNVEGVFSLNLPKDLFRDKSILLVDDVLTTGATADALARLLKHAGAEKVVVLTIASTYKNEATDVQRA